MNNKLICVILVVMAQDKPFDCLISTYKSLKEEMI